MDKYALITGASSGIGREFASIFAKNNVNLVLVARRTDLLTALANELIEKHGVKVVTLSKDLSVEQQTQELFNFCQNNGIEVEYLINNAGFGMNNLFTEIEWEVERNMIDLNIKALVLLTKLFLKPMISRKSGRILNVASTAAFIPGPRWAVYFASKAFVLSFSEAVATEIRGTGVQLTTLCPGPTRSEFGLISGANGTKLFNGENPSPKEVAEFGFKAMMKGKRLAIHGFKNKLIGEIIPRLVPRFLILDQTYKLSK